MTETTELQDTPVLSYPLASGDMRYIEIGERDIYLRNDPDTGLVFRGEISGCGAECFVELNDILLEYAMSCEGCRDEAEAREEVTRFGESLAKILLAKTFADIAEVPTPSKLSSTFNQILNSMSSKYTVLDSTDNLEYSLDCCPLRECAKNSGLIRSVEMAQISFISLCKYLVDSLAPNWELVAPIENSDIPIHKIIISVSQE